MTYAKTKDGKIIEYPVYEGDIRLAYQNVSFASPFEPPTGYERVTDVSPPQINHTQNCTEGEPRLVGGVWTRHWIVTEASTEQIAERTARQWAAVRAERDAFLLACDWTQLPDAPVDAAAWAAYRQELRDITDQSDPFNIVWPQEPE